LNQLHSHDTALLSSLLPLLPLLLASSRLAVLLPNQLSSMSRQRI
jgi:hypothetical protein